MTENKFALDTNIVSAWLKGEGPVADKIDAAESVFLPIIVIGELYYGTPIPENDIWIAAIAIQNDLTFATRDKHFLLDGGGHTGLTE